MIANLIALWAWVKHEYGYFCTGEWADNYDPLWNFESQYDYMDENGNFERTKWFEFKMKIKRGWRRLFFKMGPAGLKDGKGGWCYNRKWYSKYLDYTRWPRFIIYVVGIGWSRLMCKWFDHKYVSDDYGGPDSGGMGWHCTRCGEGHWTQLY